MVKFWNVNQKKFKNVIPVEPEKSASLAVLMGDIVGSTDSADVASLSRAFNRVIDLENAAGTDRYASPLTITLGDEFQGLTPSLGIGLDAMRRLSLEMRAAGIDCRFVLGVVRIETPVNEARAWNMMGDGLAQARRKLAEKRAPSRYRFSVPAEPMMEALLDAVGRSISETEARWTQRQFEVAKRDFTLRGQQQRSPDEIALALGVSLGGYYKVRRAARLDYLDAQWRSLEIAASALDQELGLP